MNSVVSAAAVASATAIPVFSASSRLASDLDILWEKLTKATHAGNAKSREWAAARLRIPKWAGSGPESIDSNGKRVGHEVGWPEVANPELPEKGVWQKIRLSPADIKRNFEYNASRLSDLDPTEQREAAREIYRRDMKALIARLRQQRKEKDRVGIDRIEGEMDALSDIRFDIEKRIEEINEPSVNCALARLLIETSYNVRIGETVSDPEDDLRIALIVIRHLRQLATGPVRKTIDIMLDNPDVALDDLDVMRV